MSDTIERMEQRRVELVAEMERLQALVSRYDDEARRLQETMPSLNATPMVRVNFYLNFAKVVRDQRANCRQLADSVAAVQTCSIAILEKTAKLILNDIDEKGMRHGG